MVAVPLTTLDAVKSWCSVTTADADVLLTNLMNQLSGAFLNNVNRPTLFRKTYTELRNGVGNSQLTLRQWPVVSITSVTVGNQVIPAASGLGKPGYTLDTWEGMGAGAPQELTLVGYTFCRGLNNVQIVYDAGYCILSEMHTIPSSTPYTVLPSCPYGFWYQDDGVTYANGTPLVPIASGTPSVGQYVPPPASAPAASKFYTFAAADAGQGILLNYSYVPAPVEEVVIEWIAERFRYKDRIGQSSKSLGGNETASYSLKAVPDYVALVANNYQRWLPL